MFNKVMNSKKEVLMLLFVILLSVSLIYGLTFSDTSQANFNNGTYNNTIHNGSAVVLLGSNTSGTYISRIFDATSLASWNNLTYAITTPSLPVLYAVDAQSDFWKSVDSGVSWSLVKDDYNGADGNGATDLEKNSTDLILVFNQNLWSSSDKGATWNKINDNYNGAEGQNADVLGIDSNNYIYIVEGDQDVWRSINGGVNFSKLVSNFNGGNGVVLGLVINSSGAIFAVDVSSDVWNSLDQGVTWSLVKDDFNGAIGNSVDDMAIDSSNNLYILDRQDFWKSNDNGITWTLANDDINGAGDSNSGLVSYVDQNNNIYIIDGNEDVLTSTDNGTTFAKANSSDFNGGNGNVFGLNSMLDYSNLSFHVRNCTQADCSDGNWQAVNLNNINLTGRYFQYKVFFSRDDLSIIPQLFNISIDYNLVDATNPLIDYGEGTELNGANLSRNWIYINVSVIEESESNITFSLYNSTSEVNSTTFTDNRRTINFTSLTDGVYYFNVTVFDIVGNQNSTLTRTVRVDTSSPALNLIQPQSKTYGINSSLSLNYSVSDSGIGVQSCWYNLYKNGVLYISNTTLSNCQNTTFNFDGDDSYQLNLYSNDSLGNKASNSVNFDIITTSPAINLISPNNNSYLNYNSNIYFNYTVDSGLSISTCQLWSNFNGTWRLNQTNSSTLTSINNYFIVSNLNDNSYNWGVVCNDTQNKMNNVNYTLNIDTQNPNLTLSQPSGTKSSRTGIPLNFNINDSSPLNCKYNVYRGVNLEIENTTVNCSNNSVSTTFGVTVDADFILNLYINDSAGNSNSASSTFTVSTSSGGGSSGGGGGGGGSSTTIIKSGNITTTIKLNIGKISDIAANAGDSKKISWNIENIGTAFLNDCKFKVNDPYSSWITSSEVKDLSAGEQYNFIFDINIPESTNPGNYKIMISLICKEKNEATIFNIDILNKELDLKLIKAERSSNDKIKVVYSLEELSGKDQNIELQFLLFNLNNERVAETKETKTIFANEKQQYEIFIPIDKSLKGGLNLLVNLNSGTYSTFDQENIILANPVTGLAIFNNLRGSGSFILSGIIILLFLLFAFFMIKRILTLRRKGIPQKRIGIVKKFFIPKY